MTTNSRPPGPRGLPVLGNAVEMIRDPLGFLEHVSREYGDVVRFSLPGQNIYLLNHPSAIDEAFRAQNERLIKDEFTRRLSVLVGNGLLTSEGRFWKRQRKLAQPAFHHRRVQGYAEAMVRRADRCASQIASGRTRDVHQDMMRLTLDIVAETLFGTDVAETADVIREALDAATDRFAGYAALIPVSVPTSANRRFRRAVRRLDDVVYGMIREHRAHGDRGDLLSMLLDAKIEDGSSMSDQQVRDEVVTLMLAGHETTALTLSFALHCVARNPSVQAVLLAEIQQICPGRPATENDVASLPYARAVVRESMRLYPPAWAIGREVTSPVRIAGYDLEPGTQLWMAQWVVHRDPRYFKNPETFEPERWTPELEEQLPRFAYFPFGGGPRVCIGNAFAMMEAVLLLTTIVQKCRIEPTDLPEVRLLPSATLRPRDGIHLRLRPRGALRHSTREIDRAT